MASSTLPPPDQPELDEAQLQRAWRLLRPPCWPATFAECMADPLRARMVQMFARQLVRSDANNAAQAAWATADPHQPPAPHRERRHTTSALAVGVVDRKRAAAGDRDDDDD